MQYVGRVATFIRMEIAPRIFRVHGTNYYHDEAMESPVTHSDERLAAVAHMGYDGVWIHVELRELAPTSLFGPYVHDTGKRIAALRVAAQRARKHGLGIWLYLNEPRGYPQSHPFWKEHPELAGQPGKDTAIAWVRGDEWLHTYAMCLSTEPVRCFLREAMRELFAAVPELAGAFVITASEHHTHCWSHAWRIASKKIECPRCQDRSPLEMPVEVARAMQAGLDESGSHARLAFWTWSWNTFGSPPPHQPILDDLPPRVALLSDFERGEPARRLGKQIVIDEYSLAIAGPSQQFRTYADAARAQGREVWAKLQVNATHELATVPNIPVPGILYDKISGAREAGVTGVMATWTMAVRPTLNSFAAGRLLSHWGKLPPRDEFLCQLARAYFDPSLSEETMHLLVEAWTRFEEAMKQYPTTVGFVYFSAVNYAPAYPWKWKREKTKMARSWTNDPWGDHLEMGIEPFMLREIGDLFRMVSERWLRGIPAYRLALGPHTTENVRAREELDTAEACGLFFQSCGHCYEFADAVERNAPSSELTALIEEELATCEKLLPILERDERIGFHDEPKIRMVDAPKVRAKMEQLQVLRAELSS